MTGEPLPYTLCFITRGAHVLLLERRREPNLGLWNGVGGKLTLGESPREGILREIREETGLDLTDVRFGGVVTWHSDGSLRAGAYLFVAALADDVSYVTPRETEEGILEWKELAWALDPKNERVPASARHFLAKVLDDPAQYEHHFLLVDDQIADYKVLPLDGWSDLIDPPRESAALER